MRETINQEVCTDCGTPVQEKHITCPACGAEVAKSGADWGEVSTVHESPAEVRRLGFWTGFGLAIIASGLGLMGLLSGILWAGWAVNLIAFLAVVGIAASSPRLGMRFFGGAVKGCLAVLAIAVVIGLVFGIMLGGLSA